MTLPQPDSISDLYNAPLQALIERNERTGMPELNIVGSVNDSDEVIWREQLWGIDVPTPDEPWEGDLIAERVKVLLGRFTRALQVALYETIEETT